MPHYTPSALLNRQVEITLIGAGGNGSQMLTGLARLNHALKALGHPGLFVTVFDPDFVSESNIGRQLFSMSDVGQNKAILLTHRINCFFGLQWEALPCEFNGEYQHTGNIVICCVDSRKARKEIADLLDDNSPDYLLDLGNSAATGQFVFGQYDIEAPWDGAIAPPLDHVALANPYSVLPEIIDTSLPEDNTPSCGLAAALDKQELFINQAVVTPALNVLWEFFRYGRLTWYGAFINLRTGNMRPLQVQEISQ